MTRAEVLDEFVDVSFDVVLRRGIARDQQWMTSAAEVVVGNEDPSAPKLEVRI